MNGLKMHLDWLTRLAQQSQCQESLGGRNIGTISPSVSAESHYCVNVAIPFIDHLMEEMSSRFSKDNRSRAEIFSLVPSAVVKHDSLHNYTEKLQFWQQDLPTPSSLLSELKEWQYFWKQYTPTLQLPGNLFGVCKTC